MLPISQEEIPVSRPVYERKLAPNPTVCNAKRGSRMRRTYASIRIVRIPLRDERHFRRRDVLPTRARLVNSNFGNSYHSKVLPATACSYWRRVLRRDRKPLTIFRANISIFRDSPSRRVILLRNPRVYAVLFRAAEAISTSVPRAPECTHLQIFISSS